MSKHDHDHLPADVITTGWVNVNTGCNNRCLWCYKTDELAHLPVDMPFKMAMEVVNFFSELELYSCIFIGGEPTLYPGLVDLVTQAKSSQIKEVTVVTNGRLLTMDDLANQLLQSGLDIFSVTIHSADEKVHNAITRRDSWRETVDGIKKVVSLGGKCSLNMVVGEQNYDSILPSVPVLLDLGVQQIILSCAIPCIISNEVDASNSLDPKRFADLIEKVAHCSDNVVILHELPLCLINRQTFLKLAEANRLGYGCHIGVGRGLSVDACGRVIPCNSFPVFPILELFNENGPIYTPEQFKSIWASDEEVLQLRAESNVYRSPICEKCDLWLLCNCGCPLTWGHYEPENYINDGLLGIEAETVYAWTRARYNP